MSEITRVCRVIIRTMKIEIEIKRERERERVRERMKEKKRGMERKHVRNRETAKVDY